LLVHRNTTVDVMLQRRTISDSLGTKLAALDACTLYFSESKLLDVVPKTATLAIISALSTLTVVGLSYGRGDQTSTVLHYYY
jgi:hypothetical protein